MKETIKRALTIELNTEVMEIDGIFTSSTGEAYCESVLEDLERIESAHDASDLFPKKITLHDALRLGVSMPQVGL